MLSDEGITSDADGIAVRILAPDPWDQQRPQLKQAIEAATPPDEKKVGFGPNASEISGGLWIGNAAALLYFITRAAKRSQLTTTGCLKELFVREGLIPGSEKDLAVRASEKSIPSYSVLCALPDKFGLRQTGEQKLDHADVDPCIGYIHVNDGAGIADNASNGSELKAVIVENNFGLFKEIRARLNAGEKSISELRGRRFSQCEPCYCLFDV